MLSLFDRKRPDGEAVRRVKTLVAGHFELPETTALSVAELRCHEPGCPPVETVITALHSGEKRDWRLPKAIDQVTAEDVAQLTDER